MTITHHVIFDAQNTTPLLLQEFNALGRDPVSLITRITTQYKINLDAPAEEAFEIGPEDTIVQDFPYQGRNLTILIYEDPDDEKRSFVTLIENRTRDGQKPT